MTPTAPTQAPRRLTDPADALTTALDKAKSSLKSTLDNLENWVGW